MHLNSPGLNKMFFSPELWLSGAGTQWVGDMPEMEWRSIGVLGIGSGQKWIEGKPQECGGFSVGAEPDMRGACAPWSGGRRGLSGDDSRVIVGHGRERANRAADRRHAGFAHVPAARGEGPGAGLSGG